MDTNLFSLISLLLIQLQALQGQMTGHQIAIDTLRKTAESLITSDGDLLSNSDEIQETVGKRKNQSTEHYNSLLLSR